MNYSAFRSGAQEAIAVFDAWVRSVGPEGAADHLCFKCGSVQEFEAMRAMLETESVYVYQSWISGRRIAYVKLREAFDSSLGPIGFVELSDQKTDGSQVSGFDHVEVYPLAGSLEAFVDGLEQAGQVFRKIERPHHTTYDLVLENGFKIRLEDEALIKKIVREEMK